MSILVVGVAALFAWISIDTYLTARVQINLEFKDLNVESMLTQLKFIEVDIDIEIYKVPCDLMNLHMHGDSSRNKIEWFHLYANNTIAPFDLKPSYETARQGWAEYRGCRVIATLYYDYGAKGFGFLWSNENGWLQGVIRESPRSVDFSHKINYLYLGSKSMHSYLEKYYRFMLVSTKLKALIYCRTNPALKHLSQTQNIQAAITNIR